MNKSILFGTVLALAAFSASASDTQAQSFRREGRIAAREARQEGRFDARTYGNYGNGYYGPTYYGPPEGYANYGGGNYGGYGTYGSSAYGYGPPGFYAPHPGANAPSRPYNQDLVYHGRERALLGVTLGETPQGAVNIQHVTPDSPADIAGLRRGDEILAVNGRQVYSYRDVTRVVADHLPNDTLELSIGRNGRVRQVEAVLAAGPLDGRQPRTELGPDGFPSNRQIYSRYYNSAPDGYSPRQARGAGMYNEPFAY
jgi:hypothetical protein